MARLYADEQYPYPVVEFLRVLGSIKFNLGPKLSTMTLMLQVTNSTGQQVTRSVIIETYDPNPSYPAATVAKAAAEAFANAQKAAADAQKQAPIAAPGGKDGKNQAPQLDKGTRQNR